MSAWMVLVLAVAAGPSSAPKAKSMSMDIHRLDQLLRSQADDGNVQRKGNVWQFTLHNIPMICVADPGHDRMRLISPILPARDLSAEHKMAMLEANFHSALDARYAIGDGTLFSAFIHPLGSLSDKLLLSALQQVAALAHNFGGSYSSGALSFGAPRRTPPKKDPDGRTKL